MKDRSPTKSGAIKYATDFLPMSSASIRSLAMPGLAGTPKDKKYSSLSTKLELKELVKPETASSTHSTLYLFCLFDLILYVTSTIFQLYRDGSSWVEPVLS